MVTYTPRHAALAGLAAYLCGAGLVLSADEKPESPKITPLDYINRVHVQFSEQQRFGLVCPRLPDPRNVQKPKLLTRDNRGITNNTCVRIEGYEYLYGVEIPGDGVESSGARYVKEKGKPLKGVPIPGKDKDRSWMSVWESDFGRVRITQSVEIIVGEQTQLYDTALVRYHIWNRDKTPHTVGLRVMLDTVIGSNTGVPFYVPPSWFKPLIGNRRFSARFVERMEVIAQPDMPTFIHALETNNLQDTTAALAVVGVRLKGTEPVETLVICRWPRNSEARWGGSDRPGDWKYEAITKDPCVLLYWADAQMKSGEKRELAFTYGLGRLLGDNRAVAVASGGKMRLFVGNSAVVNKSVVVVAYVKADAKQKVTLKLPTGLTLARGEKAELATRAPCGAGYSQLSWQVKAAKAGQYVIEANAPGLGTAREVIDVREASLFD